MLRTDETASQYELVISGVDTEARNPINNTLTFSLSDGGVLSDEFSITLGEEGVTETFEIKNGVVTGEIVASEGYNVARFYGFDQHGNYVAGDVIFISGSKNHHFEILSENGSPLPGFEVEVQYGEGINLVSEKALTDGAGKVALENYPDVDTLVVGAHQDFFVSELIHEGETINTIWARPAPESSPQNIGLENGLAGWSYNPNYVELGADSEGAFISAFVPAGVGTVYSHSFASDIDGEFVFNNTRLISPSESHDVLVSAINHTSGQIKTKKISNDKMEEKAHVLSSLGDLITLEVKIIPRERTTVFQRIIQKAFSAYANSGISLETKITFNEYHVEITLLDLDSESKEESPRNYRLAPMQMISVGQYVNGVNNLFAYISVESSNTNEIFLRVNEAFMRQGNQTINLGAREISELKVYDLVSEKPILLENHSRNDQQHFNAPKSLGAPDLAADVFVPFLQIQDSTGFTPYSPIQIEINFQLERGAEVSEEYNYKWGFNSSQILINHAYNYEASPHHYRHDENINFVDNGDDWSRPITAQVLEELVAFDSTLQVGDVSNVNGSSPVHKAYEYPAEFFPHGFHHDGLRFDIISSNMYRDKSLDVGGAYYLGKLVNDNDLFRGRLQKIIVDLDNTNLKKIYEHSCLMGKSIAHVVTHRSDHKNHIHFKLTEGQGIWNSDSDAAEADLQFVGFVDDEEGKGVLQYRVHTALPNLMYQVFEERENGEFVEKVTMFSDEELGSFEVDEKFIIKLVADEEEDYGPKINIELLTTDVKTLESYRVVVSGVGVMGDRKAENNCFTDEFLLTEYLVGDCNADGIEDDLGIRNKLNGIVGINARVNPDFEVSFGARVCGNTILEASNGFISREGVILTGDTHITSQCTYFSASSFNNTKLEIDNSKFCTEGPGEIIIEADNQSPHPSPIYYDLILGEEVLNKDKASKISNSTINTESFIARDAILNNVYVGNSKASHVISSELENVNQLIGDVNIYHARIINSQITAEVSSEDFILAFIDGAQILDGSDLSGSFMIHDITESPRRFTQGVQIKSSFINGAKDEIEGGVMIGGSEEAPVEVLNSEILESSNVIGIEGRLTRVSDNSKVSGRAYLSGGIVEGQSFVGGSANVSNSTVTGQSSLTGVVSIYDGSRVENGSELTGGGAYPGIQISNAKVAGGSRISGNVSLSPNSVVDEGATVHGAYGYTDYTIISGFYLSGTASGVNRIHNCSISLHNQICDENNVEPLELIRE